MTTQVETKNQENVKNDKTKSDQPNRVIDRSLGMDALSTENTATIVPDFGNMKDHWGKLLYGRRVSSERSLLEIKIAKKAIDPMMQEALKRAQAIILKDIDDTALVTLINKKGWSTEIDRVTKKINRLRLSDTRKRILDISYVAILSKLITDDTPTSEVKDELGLTEAVLYEFERDAGPMDLVAEILVVLIAQKNRIEVEQGSIMLGLMSQQLRSHF